MALLPLLCVVVLVAALGAGAAAARATPPSREGAVAAARRHARLTAGAAWVVGLLSAAATGLAGELGDQQVGVTAVGVLLAFGIAHTAVLLAGELTWPRPEGAVRRARLHRRGMLDSAPRWLLWATGTGLVLAACTIAVGAVTGTDDGRGVELSSPSGWIRSGASPFAGWYYGRPAAWGLLVLTLLVVAALWAVAERSAVATDDDAVETALRHASAHRVLRGAGGVVLFVTGGLMAVSGNALHSAADSIVTSAAADGRAVGGAFSVLSVVGTATGLLAALVALTGLVVLAVPPPAVPADRPGAAVPVRS
jgi:hypothetical protein